MARSDFLKELATASNDMMSLLGDQSRQWLVTLIAVGADGNHPSAPGTYVKLKDDRIYEIMCFFHLAGHLAKRWNAKWIPGAGEHPYRLPYSPGSKSQFAFLRIVAEDGTYDACCGTEIPVPDEPAEAPDISLQFIPATSGEAQPVKVVGIWEVKFHTKRFPLNKEDIGQMLLRCKTLRPPRLRAKDALYRFCPLPFQVNSLITNAPKKKFNLRTRLHSCFSIVFGFTGAGTGVAEPTRKEHLAFQKSRKAAKATAKTPALKTADTL